MKKKIRMPIKARAVDVAGMGKAHPSAQHLPASSTAAGMEKRSPAGVRADVIAWHPFARATPMSRWRALCYAVCRKYVCVDGVFPQNESH